MNHSIFVVNVILGSILSSISSLQMFSFQFFKFTNFTQLYFITLINQEPRAKQSTSLFRSILVYS
ncbi:hypothetical protein BLOT_011810 [Blomia tropicalis]|nr:hypothetical protein BLOT_011810 [Blomia tropicalis]